MPREITPRSSAVKTARNASKQEIEQWMNRMSKDTPSASRPSRRSRADEPPTQPVKQDPDLQPVKRDPDPQTDAINPSGSEEEIRRLKSELSAANEQLAQFEEAKALSASDQASDVNAKQAWDVVAGVQAELKAAKSMIASLEDQVPEALPREFLLNALTQAVESSQKHLEEVKRLHIELSELRAQLQCASAAETEVSDLRRKHSELQKRLKHCASQAFHIQIARSTCCSHAAHRKQKR